MAIEATNPTVVPATEERTYDKWWITRMEIVATAPPIVNLWVELTKYRTVNDNIELSNETVSFPLNDLFALAESDSELTTIMESIFAKIQGIGESQGLL